MYVIIYIHFRQTVSPRMYQLSSLSSLENNNGRLLRVGQERAG
jgi:hypothetical protein